MVSSTTSSEVSSVSVVSTVSSTVSLTSDGTTTYEFDGWGSSRDHSSPKVATKEITDLKPGEDVKVITLNQEGTVVSVDNNKKEAVVQIGIMKMTQPFKSLQKAKKDVKKTVTKSTRNIIKSKSGNVKSEVDLRGMNLEEAIMEVEKYLDDAYVAV